MSRPRVSVFLALLASLLAAACAPAAAPPSPTAAPKPAAVAATTTAPTAAAKPVATVSLSQALVDAAKAEGTVVAYSNVAADTVQVIADAFTKKYGIKVDHSKKTSGELVQLVESQQRAGKVRADLLGLLGNDAQTYLWGQQGVMARYEPESAKFLVPDLRDPAGFWVPHFITLGLIGYNTKKVKPEDLPKTFKDLAGPRWYERMATTPSRTSGAGSLFVNVLVSKYGWSFFEDLARNKPLLFASLSGLPPIVINGERDIAYPLEDNIFKQLMDRGEPIAAVYPADVVPASTALWGVPKDAERPNAAKLFIEFAISNEFQPTMVQTVGVRMANVNAPSPAGAPALKDLPINRGDAAWMVQHAREQHDRFDEIFRDVKVR